MHTNGGDKWIVFDRMQNEVVDECRSQVKAKEMMGILNTSADFFCNKPRYAMQRYDEYNNETKTCNDINTAY